MNAATEQPGVRRGTVGLLAFGVVGLFLVVVTAMSYVVVNLQHMMNPAPPRDPWWVRWVLLGIPAWALVTGLGAAVRFLRIRSVMNKVASSLAVLVMVAWGVHGFQSATAGDFVHQAPDREEFQSSLQLKLPDDAKWIASSDHGGGDDDHASFLFFVPPEIEESSLTMTRATVTFRSMEPESELEEIRRLFPGQEIAEPTECRWAEWRTEEFYVGVWLLRTKDGDYLRVLRSRLDR